MKINTKIISFVVLFLVLFFIGFVALWSYNQSSIQHIKETRTKEYQTSFESIVKLMDKTYTSILFENTYWDDMVAFTSKQDQVWADENLNSSMTSAEYEYTAIFNNKNSLVYYAQVDDKIASLKAKLQTLEFDMNVPTFYEYYIEQNDQYIKLFVAPIQPTFDAERKTKPAGYLLMGKIVSAKYIETLSLQTKHKITLVSTLDDKSYDFSYPLLSNTKKPLAYLGVNIKSQLLDNTEDIFKEQLIVMIIAAMLLVLCLAFLIYSLIIKPLKILTNVIQKNECDSLLENLAKQEDEFGTIALSVQGHFEHIHLLKEYKHIVDISSIVSKTDAKGVITYANDKFCAISGYTREELLGNTHSLLKHPDMDPLVYKELWYTIKNEKKTWFGTIKNKAKDGSAYYVDSVINPIFNRDGELIEYIAIRHDITDNEEIKNDMKEQYHITSNKYDDVLYLSKSYEQAIEASNIILRVDLDRNITYANDMFCEISGYSLEELVGKPYSILKHPDTDEKDIEELWRVIESGNIWKGNLKNLSKNGDTKYSMSTVVPIKNKDEKIIEYIGIRKDITELVNLHNEIEETQRELIYTLGEIGETRSKETGNHVKRVAEYSKLLALKAGLSKEDAELLKYASPMHDIGKIGIPDMILNKPGKLTVEEFAVMKNHSSIGYEMLKGSARPILQTSAIVANEHHEKWDGSGYPKGLEGEDIHIFGRITAIADVFDALASDRPYKKSWDLEKILALFKEQRGKHFDPKLIDIFFDNLDEFLEIRNRLH
ncbi:MAG: PAS domain S-box protein [Arcobacteraceae bacterium]